jgi:hypothetical protein
MGVGCSNQKSVTVDKTILKSNIKTNARKGSGLQTLKTRSVVVSRVSKENKSDELNESVQDLS